MKTKPVKLFNDQPPLTKAAIDDLTQRGLLVPDATPYESTRRNCMVNNPTAGQVVGHRYLAEKLRDGLVSIDDAKRLLAVEAVRPRGPRPVHVDRLLALIYQDQRGQVLTRMEEAAKVSRDDRKAN